jgi:hypothetical protein
VPNTCLRIVPIPCFFFIRVGLQRPFSLLFLSERNITERNITESNITERNITDSNITERNITERNITERNITLLLSDSHRRMCA